MSGSRNVVVTHRMVDGTAVPGLAGDRVAVDVFLPVQRVLDVAATVALGAGRPLSVLPGNVVAKAGTQKRSSSRDKKSARGGNGA
jgi:hypothetical protein